MNAHVELLIQIQDLDLMIQEMSNEKTASAEKKMGFEIKGLETLRDTREALAKQVDGALLARYDRIQSRFPRAIVPMRDGVCFGCFVRQPAKRGVAGAAAADPN